MQRVIVLVVGVVALAVQANGVRAEVNAWTGAAGPAWDDPGNWSLGAAPSAGQDVEVSAAGATPVLSGPSAALASFTIANGSLVFSNWTARLQAGTVTVAAGGVLTLPPAFAAGAMSNRIAIACQDCTVQPGGLVDANEKGYTVGHGPGLGFGSDRVGGAGHGGKGGSGFAGGNTIPGGIEYGSAEQPETPGSAGPYCYTGPTSGRGGGVIRIEAEGTVTVHGTISANGQHAQEAHAGGGAGGSVWITCASLAGSTNGLIAAKGGNAGQGDPGGDGGGGGGGRIALAYSSCDLPSIRLTVQPGFTYFTAGGDTRAARMGTISLSTTQALAGTVANLHGRLVIPGFSAWSPGALTVDGGTVGLPAGLAFDASALAIQAGARLEFGAGSDVQVAGLIDVHGSLLADTGSVLAAQSVRLAGETVLRGDLDCTGNLELTNGATFYVYSGPTNGAAVNYGSGVSAGCLAISPGCWILPFAQGVDGGTPLFRAGSAQVAAGGGFNAVGAGYDVGKGPGTVPFPPSGWWDNTSGGSYGGKGGVGANWYAPGPTYGSELGPYEAGSGAGYHYLNTDWGSGRGGGAIRLDVAGELDLAGTLDASGGYALDSHGGGGAGGSVCLTARRIRTSPTTVIRASGGNGGGGAGWGGGGGGGGRIALWLNADRALADHYLAGSPGGLMTETNGLSLPGTFSVAAGTGYVAPPPSCPEDGTLRIVRVQAGTVITIW